MSVTLLAENTSDRTHLGVDTSEHLLWQHSHQGPGNIERIVNRSVFVCALVDKPLLESLEELQAKLVLRRQGILTNNGLHRSAISAGSVESVQGVGHIAVVLACHALSNGRFHQTDGEMRSQHLRKSPIRNELRERDNAPTQRTKHLNGRVDLAVVELSVNVDLSFGNVASQVGNGVRHVFVWHGQDRNLCDGSIATRDSTSTLVDGRQVGVHVTRVTTTTWNLFTGSRDLTQSVGVRRHVSQDDQNVLLQLVSVVFGRGEGQTRRNDTLNTTREVLSGSEIERLYAKEGHTHVGSFAKLRKRVTLSSDPFSSKSCLKKRAVSMLTPMAAKTMLKLSSWSS